MSEGGEYKSMTGNFKHVRYPRALLPRWCHRLFAFVWGYYWLPCAICGRHYGGHEAGGLIPTGRGLGKLVCRRHNHADCAPAWRKFYSQTPE